MLRPLAKLAVIIVAIWLVSHFWPWREIRHEPGVLVKDDPIQTNIDAMSLPPVKDYKIEAVALYDITARVLHTKRYWAGRGSELVPIDVAVSWGRMSDQAVLDQLSISQSNRFYFYEWMGQPPIPLQEIITHSANMHLIAATSRVTDSISHLRAGQVVSMHGYLVNVSTSDGFHWRTSLTRSDTGNGACELFYVENVQECPVKL